MMFLDAIPLPSLSDQPAALLADIPPTWRQSYAQQQQQQTACKAVSTDPVQVRDADVQTTDRCDAGCQASTSGRSGSAGHKLRSETDVQAFMQRVGAAMLSAVSANAEHAAAAAGRPTQHSGASQSSSACQLFTLTAYSCSNLINNSSSSSNRSTIGRPNPHKLQVTSLSWSKTGQTLAASFGRYDIGGWCCLPGAIATWTLARLSSSSGADSSGRPDRIIDVDTCVMCCAFHPSEPALLAGGTFNGELVIWDLSKDDANAQVGKTSVLSELRHREPITSISWQYSGQEARRRTAAAAAYRLFTLGADGRLRVWLWDQLGDPVYGYELQLVQPGRGQAAGLCSSCMAFCPAASAHEEASLLLVGTEGGQLLRCQVNDLNDTSLKDFASRVAAAAAAPAGTTGSRVKLHNAVHSANYKPFAAPVNALSACPHHRQLAVAAGGDGTLRVLDVLRSEPLLLLEPAVGSLLAAGWSPSRPLVFAGASAHAIHLYDLAVKQRIVRPVLQLPFADAGAGGKDKINAVVFNPHIPGMIAAAAGDVISVWALPRQLVEQRQGEVKLLRKLLDAEDAPALLRAQYIVK